MLKWICHPRLTHLHWEGPEGLHVTTTVEINLSGSPGIIDNLGGVSLCQPDFAAEPVVRKLRNQMQWKELEPWMSGANGQHLTAKSMVGLVVVVASKSK